MTGRKRQIVGAIGVLLIGWSTGILDPAALDVPVWWRLIATAGFLALVVGWIAAGMIADLLPEEHGTFLVAFDDTRLGGGEIWELNDDKWEDLTVSGSLKKWEDSTKDVYECREYDPELNRAIGNWRESKPGSALAAEATVEDALAAIRELRLDLEPDAAESREIKRRIRGIIRTLDRERAEAQQSLIDKHAAPNVGGSRTISEVLEDELPDDYHPEAMKDEETDPDPVSPHPENDEISFDVLDDEDDALPVVADGGADE